MKKLILAALLVIPVFAFSQSSKDLFLQIPKQSIRFSGESVADLVIETKGDFLRFRLSEARAGEFKVLSQKNGETFVGMTYNDCDENTLIFWKIKHGIWKDVTKEAMKPLGKNDVVNILRVSPVSIRKLDEQPSIATFYQFSPESTSLKLLAKKQNSCETAGIVYIYGFNGKKFEIE